jgi:hypothetical protein
MLEACKIINNWWTLGSTSLPYLTIGAVEVPVAIRVETPRGDKFISPHTITEGDEQYLSLGTWDIPRLKMFLSSEEVIYRTYNPTWINTNKT